MCGIVGYVGKTGNIQRKLIESLKTLEYRGYDSSGIAFVSNNKVNIIKKEGKISNLEKVIDETIEGNLGIAHTRWATHGKASDENSHPHKKGGVTIVHNGIIENYLELKTLLLKEGYKFDSDTDTEVACAYLDYLKKKNNNNLEVIQEFAKDIKGSYALGIIFDDDLNTLYATRLDSPLIIGIGDKENLIASDVSAITNFTKKYALVDNYDIVKLTKDNVIFYDNNLKEKDKLIESVNWDIESASKCGYDHYMLKEIHEEADVYKKTINEYCQNIDEFLKVMPDFKKYSKIHIVACGSAMHAGLVGKYLIENDDEIEVIVDIASEYRYKKVFYDKNTLVILISQSGETADTIASLRKAKEYGIDTLGIVNVTSSTIAREVDKVLYIKAGVEVAVATTKAYLLQVLMLVLIDLKIKYDRKMITKDELDKVLQELKLGHIEIQKVINNYEEYFKIANKLYQDSNIFFIGRGIDYALCMEGSLKLKEISYIHSEAYQAGELKHGTISLIDDKTNVIAVMTDEDIYLKTISNIKEVKSRGAHITLITTDKLNKEYEFVDNLIVINNDNKYLIPLLTIIPLQFISYKTALLRGCDIDKPRNLAKSVTVE